MSSNIIVVGASAGGLEAVQELVAALPLGLDAAVFVVVHTSPDSPGILPDILNRRATLTAITPQDGERIKTGYIYVAPPDFHLLLEPGIMRLSRGPRENRFRPAVDPLFRSAAQTYGPRVIGVILSGGLDDGTAGLWAVKKLGGITVVQDPETAMFDGMPRNALRYVNVDHCVPLNNIGPLLVELIHERVIEEEAFAVLEDIKIEVEIAKEKAAIDAGVLKIGEPSLFSCPECHGVLLKLNESEQPRFRCHTGHAYSAESLLASIEQDIGESLWKTVRALEEAVLLMQNMAEHVAERDGGPTAEVFHKSAQATEHRVDLVRQAAMHLDEGRA